MNQNTIGALFEKLQRWYANECNGDWEHSFGITIETLDNPGWLVKIDLMETEWEGIKVERSRDDRDDNNWAQHEIVNSQFIGCGGIDNLAEILSRFFEIVEKESPRAP
jgi:hypothetical protein